ncbi:TPA: hypothetical protein ACM36I_000353 [Escherichia coli]|uniref:hypothetical protein n=1 Tax=Escherichia coli TaxID=562 RepID=UPI000BEAAC70|nr:hypothetical protein [Escherichia coli]EFG7836917.1 hypothetical protein [Escherichia coli]EGJ6461975.1 hypothetical protein [Escherichia coli]EGU1714692.1 hypothetical protein [Escherichia coli]EJE2982029.1 hypothetical protein [Escherichia coli]ELL7344231.1 hypothetical protein [Escherichia coli]
MDYRFFVKLFSQDSFREGFINGQLYMNPLSYFIKVEDESANNVADKHEGVSGWLQPDEHILKIGLPGEEIILTQDDFAGPITIKMDWVDNINVFCMTHLHSHGILSRPFYEHEVDKLKGYYKLPPKAENLGQYFALVWDEAEFMSRVIKKLDSLVASGEVLAYRCEPIVYFDEKETLKFDQFSLASVFNKRSSYSHQNEYRIAIYRASPDGEPFTLDIGHIGDIVKIGNTREFNEMIKLDLNK